MIIKSKPYSDKLRTLGVGVDLRWMNLVWFLMVLLYPLGAPSQAIMSPLERVIFDKDKREAVFHHLQVPNGQAGSFWKIYEDYEGVRRGLLEARLKLIKKHAEISSKATGDKKARRIIRRLLINDVDHREMYKEYYSRTAPILGATKALQFIHIEEYFQLRLQARLDRMLIQENYLIVSKGGG